WFVYPDRTVDDRTRIQLGGRELILQAHPTAHTSNDLTVRDPDTGTWWLGDLLFVDRMPTLDGSLTGWRKVLDRLDDRAAKRVVPGHGPPAVAWPKAARPLEAYLKDLEQQVRSALDQGQTLTDVVLAAQRREDPDWALFKRVHPRNVSKAYTELEWQ
ncbi:MAG TPA: MBL fold metallo-hydrolase, partial [Gammaproteobacteria bacterium]|nr:MBL fold metallo-hydrolase [Gammaproteobacteria bacterium]